jgi:hypothetical protein
VPAADADDALLAVVVVAEATSIGNKATFRGCGGDFVLAEGLRRLG